MVRIRRKLESETLHLPEARALVGKMVEITITDEDSLAITPGTGDWVAAESAARELRDSGYDFDAWSRQRDCDLRHAQEHLP